MRLLLPMVAAVCCNKGRRVPSASAAKHKPTLLFAATSHAMQLPGGGRSAHVEPVMPAINGGGQFMRTKRLGIALYGFQNPSTWFPREALNQ